MDTILNLLNATVFTALGAPVSVVEIIGFVTGALCVYGVAVQAIWNWGVGILNNAAFALMFIGVGLYADFTLQIIFAVIGVYGWWKWVRGDRDTGELPVRRATRPETAWLTIAAILGTAAVAVALAAETNSRVPFWDSLVLSLSLVATYGQAKKILSSWYIWILVDLISVPLYFSKHLALTALLYIGFTALCVLGLVNWVKDLRAQQAIRNAVPSAATDTTAGAEAAAPTQVRAAA